MAWFYECDGTAFEELWWCRLREQLYRFVRSKGVSRDDAEDVLSEVRAKILQTKHQPSLRFDPQKGVSLRAWAWKIASNTLADFLHSRHREPLFSDLIPQEPGNGEDAEIPEVPEGAVSLLGSEADLETEIIVRDAVEKLSEPSRTIVREIFWCGLSQSDIGEKLGLSTPTVNRKLAHDLEVLKEMLEGSL